MKNRMRAMAAVAVMLSLALAGCSSGDNEEDSSPGAASAADVNDADVMFATMMIPHHEQAIEMSDIVLGKQDIDPAVSDLAEQIKQAQGPEITQLQGWLQDWGVDPDDASGMDHSEHGGMDGMMSESDMAALESADGAEASRLFLEQMIEHHEGAIDMAQTQVDDGESTDAIALAQDIVDTQAAEIDQMRNLLADL
jgi:uncharacterized protein (DUF305 family)